MLTSENGKLTEIMDHAKFYKSVTYMELAATGAVGGTCSTSKDLSTLMESEDSIKSHGNKSWNTGTIVPSKLILSILLLIIL